MKGNYFSLGAPNTHPLLPVASSSSYNPSQLAPMILQPSHTIFLETTKPLSLSWFHKRRITAPEVRWTQKERG